MAKTREPKDPRTFNAALVADSELKISADQVPTLIPDDALKLITEGDTEPYHKIEAIDYPIKANGLIYEESFFEEYLGKTHDAPVPGSKDGHHMDWGRRAPTDLFLVGGKLDKNGDGTGTVYLKNYIPPEGATTSNRRFMQEARSGMIHFSLVALTREERMQTEDGDWEWHVIGSIGAERNDAVERGMGAMQQTVTNTKNNANGTEPEGEEEPMEKAEMLKKLATMRANGDLQLTEVAKAFGFEIVTDAHTEAVRVNKSIAGIVGDGDLVALVQAQADQIKQNAADVFDARMTTEFGPEEDETGKDNLVRLQANSLINQDGDLDKQIEEAKKNPIMLKLRGEQADVRSNANKVGLSEGGDESTDGGLKKTVY